MFGCFRRIGCLVVLCVAAVAAYLMRDRWIGYVPWLKSTPRATTTTAGGPKWEPVSDNRRDARASGDRVVRQAQRAGVRQPAPRRTRDVLLHRARAAAAAVGGQHRGRDDREPHVRPRGDLVDDFKAADALGPLSGFVGRRERMQIGGTFAFVRPGLAQFLVEDVRLGEFPIPRGAIPKLLRRSGAGHAAEGVVRERAAVRRADVHRRRARGQRKGHPLQDHRQVSRRILIVDDEQGIRAALGQLLEFEGYEVRAVGNAVDGIAEYAKWRPDLVFLDVKMAGIDGARGAEEDQARSIRARSS